METAKKEAAACMEQAKTEAESGVAKAREESEAYWNQVNEQIQNLLKGQEKLSALFQAARKS